MTGQLGLQKDIQRSISRAATRIRSTDAGCAGGRGPAVAVAAAGEGPASAVGRPRRWVRWRARVSEEQRRTPAAPGDERRRLMAPASNVRAMIVRWISDEPS